jgi:hypothetical protein
LIVCNLVSFLQICNWSLEFPNNNLPNYFKRLQPTTKLQKQSTHKSNYSIKTAVTTPYGSLTKASIFIKLYNQSNLNLHETENQPQSSQH